VSNSNPSEDYVQPSDPMLCSMLTVKRSCPFQISFAAMSEDSAAPLDVCANS